MTTVLNELKKKLKADALYLEAILHYLVINALGFPLKIKSIYGKDFRPFEISTHSNEIKIVNIDTINNCNAGHEIKFNSMPLMKNP
ncbi:MAG: hypothetical protein NC453_11210 [Muribaculum sp.]|nr:hypothetical protein [Muribaculum sp.]